MLHLRTLFGRKSFGGLSPADRLALVDEGALL